MAAEPSGAEAYAALAAQVSDLRGKLLASDARATRLNAQVGRLADLVSSLMNEDVGPGPEAPYWLDLGPAEYKVRVKVLAEWVTKVLLGSYGLYWRGLQPCWPQHPEAIWELSTLHAEWSHTYERKHPDLERASAWHDRWMPGVAARLAGTMTSCDPSKCRLAARR